MIINCEKESLNSIQISHFVMMVESRSTTEVLFFLDFPHFDHLFSSSSENRLNYMGYLFLKESLFFLSLFLVLDLLLSFHLALGALREIFQRSVFFSLFRINLCAL